MENEGMMPASATHYLFDYLGNELTIARMSRQLKQVKDIDCINARITAYGLANVETVHISKFDSAAVAVERLRRRINA